MALTASRLPPFEQQARALAEVWLTAMADPSLLARQAEEILASSAAQDRPKLAALSLALDATVTVYVRSDHPGAMARVAALFDAVRAVGWERATRLAEAALSPRSALPPPSPSSAARRRCWHTATLTTTRVRQPSVSGQTAPCVDWRPCPVTTQAHWHTVWQPTRWPPTRDWTSPWSMPASCWPLSS
jgi:hypothetical protein